MKREVLPPLTRSNAVSRMRPVENARAMTASPTELAIVVPTFCELGNIREVIREVAAALPGISWEIVFVDDDSTDGTVDEIRTLAQQHPNVRCLHRIGRRGLSSACIEGMLCVSAPVVAVMDADLQHDTSKLREMLDAIRNGADVAVGTRALGDGSFGAMSNMRQRISSSSSRLAKALLRIELSDPMSGFFMLRRPVAMTVVRDLSGMGFKILLDIVASLPPGTKVVEVPYEFRSRHAGESKLDSNAAVEFLMLLADKTVGRFVPIRFLAFSIIGGLGVFVHFAILTTLFKGAGISFAMSQMAAAGITMMFNFLLNNSLTFRDHRLKGWRLLTGLASFVAISSVGAVGNVGIASVLFSDYHVNWTGSALVGIVVGAVWNYAMSRAFTWRAAAA